MSRLLCLGLLVGLLTPSFAVAQPQSDLESRRKTLTGLLAEQWEYTLRTSPLYASILGDKRWNDKLDDFSQQAIDKDLQETQKFLIRFQAIDTGGFPEQEMLNQALMVRDLQMKIERRAFQGLGDAGSTELRHSHRFAAIGERALLRQREGL
jgi:uncharacterized protein (DUF885 family)